MAQVGLSKPFYAMYAMSSGSVYYSSGDVLAKAVNADIAPDTGDANVFYADNGPAESAAVFSGGTLTLDIDHLSYSVAGALLGLTPTQSSTPSGGYVLAYKAGTVAPSVGVGLVFKNIVGGSAEYVGVVLHKVQFNVPELSQATQGESIEFTAPQLTATILRDDTTDEVWKTEGYFSSESDAVTFVKGILSIT